MGTLVSRVRGARSTTAHLFRFTNERDITLNPGALGVRAEPPLRPIEVYSQKIVIYVQYNLRPYFFHVEINGKLRVE